MPKLFYLALERAVDLEEESTLEALLENINLEENGFRKAGNLPALLKACAKNNAKLVTLLVENGFLLRYYR